ncbi:MAG: cation diffusion facilitator family transporter [Rhodothermales bacterium]
MQETHVLHLGDRARRLSYFTVGYNVLEGAASIIAGTLAGSVALVGFGLDSFVESLSGSVMIWRFQRRDALSRTDEERLEQRALKLVGYTFFVLGLYIVYEAGRTLYEAEPPDPSIAGMIITSLSLIVMPVLFYAKYRTGRRLESRSLIADSKQTLACMLLSAAVLAGLVLNATLGFWQIDPIIGLLIAGFLFKEGRDAVKEGKVCSC